MNPDFSDLLQVFNANNVEYLIVGGYAVIEYTEPRYTKDLDIWVRASIENATRIYRALTEFGAPLGDVTADDFAEEGYVFQIGVAPVRIDILMSIDGITFEQAWPNRVRRNFGSVEGNLISLEDLITAKRAAGRPQDIQDANNLEKRRSPSRNLQGNASDGTTF